MQNKRSNVPWYRLPALVVVIGTFVGLLIYAFIMREDIKTAKIDAPLISAPNTPVKRRPDQPGGMEIPNRDKLVFDLLTSDIKTGIAKVQPKEVVTSKRLEPKMAAIEPVKTPELKINLNLEKPKEIEPKITERIAEVKKTAAAKVEVKNPKPITTSKPVGWGVQLASFVSRDDAILAQNNYLKIYSNILFGHTPNIEGVDIGNNKGMRYRVQFFSFNNKTSAVSACNKLKIKRQGCLYIKR